MMNKKIMAILALLIIVASTTAIYAATSDDTVEVDNIEFSLPDGFQEDPSEEKVNEPQSVGGIEYTICQKLFNKDTTYVSILVAQYGDYKVNDDIVKSIGGNRTTIKGVDGYLDYSNGIYMFNFAKDDKLVTITSSDKDVIQDFIK